MTVRAPRIGLLFAGFTILLLDYPLGGFDALPDALGFAFLAWAASDFMHGLGGRPSREPARRATGAFAIGLVAAVPESFLVDDPRLALTAIVMAAAGSFFLALSFHRLAWESADGGLADSAGAAMACALPLSLCVFLPNMGDVTAAAFGPGRLIATALAAGALIAAAARARRLLRGHEGDEVEVSPRTS